MGQLRVPRGDLGQTPKNMKEEPWLKANPRLLQHLSILKALYAAAYKVRIVF
jgi:hypothetical protein